jgi:hypothetical protein
MLSGVRGACAAAVVVVAVLASGCAAIDRMSGQSEARRLQGVGIPATARILRIWDTGMTLNDDPVVGLEVEITRPDGSVYQTTIPKSRVSRVDIPQVQPGANVPVRIDPDHPLVVALDMYKYR